MYHNVSETILIYISFVSKYNHLPLLPVHGSVRVHVFLPIRHCLALASGRGWSSQNESLKGRVPPVLNGIVRSSGKTLGNFCPLVAQFVMSLDNGGIFLVRPFGLVDMRIQMIVPTFPTLLAETSRELACNERPLLLSVNLDQSCDRSVFFWCPGTLDETGLEHLLPPMETLDVAATRKVRGNLFPILARVFRNGMAKLLVLFFGPFLRGHTALRRYH